MKLQQFAYFMQWLVKYAKVWEQAGFELLSQAQQPMNASEDSSAKATESLEKDWGGSEMQPVGG